MYWSGTNFKFGENVSIQIHYVSEQEASLCLFMNIRQFWP